MNDEIKRPNIWAVEEWWRHNGCYDREQATGYPYDGKDTGKYLRQTDMWWDTLTDDEKIDVYIEFFDEG